MGEESNRILESVKFVVLEDGEHQGEQLWQEGGDKCLLVFPIKLVVSSNHYMVVVINSEENSLKEIAIFLIALDCNKLPTKKFIDEWINNVWFKKLRI